MRKGRGCQRGRVGGLDHTRSVKGSLTMRNKEDERWLGNRNISFDPALFIRFRGTKKEPCT